MSGAPRWRVRGAKPKVLEKEGWVLVGRGKLVFVRIGWGLALDPACLQK